jgi:hypothetical protein
MTTQFVTGYIFESFTDQRAMAFNFFNQNDNGVMVRVCQNGRDYYMLIESNDYLMRELCNLLKESYKCLVTVDVTKIERFQF